MSYLNYLLEELNSYQKSLKKQWLDENEEDGTGLDKDYHDKLFQKYTGKANATRLEIPVVSHNSVNSEIYAHLKNHGWIIHDYKKGIAVKNIPNKYEEDKIVQKSIGKVLAETDGDNIIAKEPLLKTKRDKDNKEIRDENGMPVKTEEPQSLSSLYANDHNRSNVGSKLKLIISRHPDDIMEMSTNKNWTNCTTLPHDRNDSGGEFHDHIQGDLNHQTLVAYLMHEGDDDIKNAIGRGLLKRYDSSNETTFRPEQRTYGSGGNTIINTLQNFANKEFPVKKSGNFVKNSDLYNDDKVNKIHIAGKADSTVNDNVSEILSSRGLKLNNVKISNVVANKNLAGELHSVGKSPSLTADLGHGRTLEMHHHNGVEHAESNAPSMTIKKGNDVLYSERKTMGDLHSSLDNKPSLEDSTINGRVNKYWHKFGNAEVNPATGFSHEEERDDQVYKENTVSGKREQFMDKPSSQITTKGLTKTSIRNVYNENTGSTPFVKEQTVDGDGKVVRNLEMFKDYKVSSHEHDPIRKIGKVTYADGSIEEYNGGMRKFK